MALAINAQEAERIKAVQDADQRLESRVGRNVKVGLLMILSGLLLTGIDSGSETLQTTYNISPALLNIASHSLDFFTRWVAPVATIALPVNTGMAFRQHVNQITQIGPNRLTGPIV